jgi:hypothetical protein
MGARDRKKRLQYHGFELYGIKAIKYMPKQEYMPIVEVFQKKRSTPQPPALQKRCPVR